MTSPDPAFAHRTRTNVRRAAAIFDLSGNLIVVGEVDNYSLTSDGVETFTVTAYPETDAHPTEDTH